MIVKNGDVEAAILIMKEVAKWLIIKGEPIWEITNLTKEKLLGTNLSENNFYTAWEYGKPIAAMILQWYDPEFWPNIGPFESGFIHKLCVSREYAGKGISTEMIFFAELECKNKDIKKLRLDCDANRHKLCSFYENYGFKEIDRRKIGIYNIAFYEKNIE